MFILLAFASFACTVLADATDPFAPIQAFDNLTFGPALTLEHLFEDQWPTGLGVSSTGKIYVNFPTQLNTTNTQFTVGVVTNMTSEAAFPSVEANQPPDGFLNASNPAYGSGDPDHLVSVQSVVVDAKDRVWALDTGRPLDENGVMVLSSFGGPKLVGFDQNGTKVANIVLPTDVAFPDSYLNDVRFDLRAEALPSGEGVAYITDSSNEGRNGIIVIDLGTGDSWRHLSNTPVTRADPGFVSTYDGMPFVPVNQGPPSMKGVRSPFTTGSDGIALSADGEDLYFSVLASRRFYRVPTSLLRVQPSAQNPNALSAATAGVQTLGQLGGSHADGLETDSTGTIYIGAPEQDAISMFDPSEGVLSAFVRDPRIQWPDTLSVATNGRLYFTSNQYWKQPSINNGTDLRMPPFEIFSVPIAGSKVELK